MKFLRIPQQIACCFAAAALIHCAPLSIRGQLAVSKLANHDAQWAQGGDSCRAALESTPEDVGTKLDSTKIKLFVWNIQKSANPDALADLNRLAHGMDLVLLQEANFEKQPVDVLDAARFWSFAPGHHARSAWTGVMTLSKIEPTTHCLLRDREPWLRSPKAIGITEFRLTGSDETLAVVNVHALNFTFGVSGFARQIAKIESALADHEGPVILAGDFNTWRSRRIEILRALSESLELKELSFEEDNRVKKFGRVVDRIYIRGLIAVEAKVDTVSSSDHNPMSVTLRRRG